MPVRLVIILSVTLSYKVYGTDPRDLTRIIGGSDALEGEAPHAASIAIEDDSKSYQCGASILNQASLLTAAHCIATRPKQIGLSVGQTRSIFTYVRVKVTINEHYSEVQFHRDIGLIWLKKPLQLGPLVKRVAVMRKPPDVSDAIVCGWGRVSLGVREVSENLKCARQKILSNEKCAELLKGKRFPFPRSLLCTMNRQDDAEYSGFASFGDSGSGLVIEGYIVVGVVAFGDRHDSRHITRFTNVSYFYNWIVNEARRLLTIECKKDIRGCPNPPFCEDNFTDHTL